MLLWLSENLATIIVAGIVAVLLILAFVKIIRDRRAGIGVCGGDCSKCHGSCGGHVHERAARHERTQKH